MVVCALLSASAHATVSGVNPSDETGATDDHFYTNEILYATGVNNALSGGAELCVIHAGSSTTDCAESAWGRPNVITVHGTFVAHPIAGAPLTPGVWQILADNGDEGDVRSDQFTVSACPEDMDCSTTLADQQMQAWKDAAAAARTGMGAICLGSSIWKGGGAGTAGSAVLGGGLRGAIVAEIKGSDLDFTQAAGTQNGALALLRSISCGTYVMYDDIVADPPDPAYKDLVEAEPASSAAWSTFDGSATAALRELEEMRASGVAHRIGVERYQGAMLADDHGWAAAHLDRVGDQALATQAGMRKLGALLDSAAGAIGAGTSAPTAEEQATAEAIRERVRVSGFTTAERAALVEQGFSDADIVSAREQIGAPLPDGQALAPDVAIYTGSDWIDTATCIDESDLCGFDVMGRHAKAAGANGYVAPTASVQSLELRESDVGVNHARVKVELSHPAQSYLGGGFEVTPQSTDEGEVEMPANGWLVPQGDTIDFESITIRNDTADEPTETAQIAAAYSAGGTGPPATITILDDDGADDPPTRPRSQRGVIALQGSHGAAFMTEPDGTELTNVFGPDFTLSLSWFPAWSPDGRWLLAQAIAPTASALAAGGEPIDIYPVRADGTVTAPPELLVEGKPWRQFPSFSRDGKRLLTIAGTYDFAVYPFDTKTGSVGTPHVTGDDEPVKDWFTGHGAGFSPDRSRIVFAGCDPGIVNCGIYVVPVDDIGAATGPPVAVRAVPPNTVYHPTWSPDGRLIAFYEFVDDTLAVRTVRVNAAGVPAATPRTVASAALYCCATPMAWAPDSASLAYMFPVDPMLRPNEGGSTQVADVAADGARVGQPTYIGLTGWGSTPLWGSLPDLQPPVTTLTTDPATPADGIHRGKLTVHLEATDDRQVAAVEYSVGDGAAKTINGDGVSLALETAGTHIIRFRARDAAGNLEAQKERTIRVEFPVALVQTPAPEPTPTATPTASPPPPAPPKVAPASLPSNRKCVSRRKFRIRLRESKDDPLARAEVFVGKKRVKVVTGARLTAPVDLRGLPKGKIVVRVVGVTRSGRRAVSRRTYRTCVKKRR